MPCHRLCCFLWPFRRVPCNDFFLFVSITSQKLMTVVITSTSYPDGSAPDGLGSCRSRMCPGTVPQLQRASSSVSSAPDLELPFSFRRVPVDPVQAVMHVCSAIKEALFVTDTHRYGGKAACVQVSSGGF